MYIAGMLAFIFESSESWFSPFISKAVPAVPVDTIAASSVMSVTALSRFAVVWFCLSVLFFDYFFFCQYVFAIALSTSGVKHTKMLHMERLDIGSGHLTGATYLTSRRISIPHSQGLKSVTKIEKRGVKTNSSSGTALIFQNWLSQMSSSSPTQAYVRRYSCTWLVCRCSSVQLIPTLCCPTCCFRLSMPDGRPPHQVGVTSSLTY